MLWRVSTAIISVLPRAVDERRPGQLEEGECGEFRNPVSDNMFILSPNYPFNYPDRLSCEKLIEGEDSDRLLNGPPAQHIDRNVINHREVPSII